MLTRAKFKLTGITQFQNGSREFTFDTEYDDKTPEDQQFHRYTPWGQIKMSVTNPAVFDRFTLGHYYYADFSEVD